MVDEHLHILLVGLLLLHVSSFAIISATNSFVNGISQPSSKGWFDICVFLVDILFLFYTWDYRKRWLGNEASKIANKMQSPDEIQMSERSVDVPAGILHHESSVKPEAKDVSLEVRQLLRRYL